MGNFNLDLTFSRSRSKWPHIEKPSAHAANKGAMLPTKSSQEHNEQPAWQKGAGAHNRNNMRAPVPFGTARNSGKCTGQASYPLPRFPLWYAFPSFALALPCSDLTGNWDRGHPFEGSPPWGRRALFAGGYPFEGSPARSDRAQINQRGRPFEGPPSEVINLADYGTQTSQVHG